ncbi:MAG: serine protein kinase RIO [Methanobacteriota archaeon]|nr:MAG: serine protein kinase RIO [Euryarchaeota archaeon]
MRLLESRIDSFRIREKDADDRKVVDEVFDQETLMALYKMFNDKIMNTLEYAVSTGKEGNVFMATSDDGDCAVKIYRISTSTFKNISKYIVGDPRFKGIYGSHKKTVLAWAQKEYKNLNRMYDGEVNVPKPKGCYKNILVMDYVSIDGLPAPLLKEVRVSAPTKVYRNVVENMRLIEESGLVHGDLSEYNILMRDGEPVIIDVGQAVTLDHPLAEEWFMRDVTNITNYFTRIGVQTDPEKVIKKVRGG